MTLNDLEQLFHDKMRFRPALLKSERLNVRNSTTSAILRCSVHFTIYIIPIPIQLPQRNSASAAHVCAADALFLCGSWASCYNKDWIGLDLSAHCESWAGMLLSRCWNTRSITRTGISLCRR